MKEVGFRIKNYAKVDIVSNNNIEKRVLNALLYTLGAFALLYVLMLSNMVWNIVERKSLEAEAKNISNEVGNLELTYLDMFNKVDLSLSSKMGFYEIKPDFATRKSLGVNSSNNFSISGSSIVKLAKNEI